MTYRLRLLLSSQLDVGGCGGGIAGGGGGTGPPPLALAVLLSCTSHSAVCTSQHRTPLWLHDAAPPAELCEPRLPPELWLLLEPCSGQLDAPIGKQHVKFKTRITM